MATKSKQSLAQKSNTGVYDLSTVRHMQRNVDRKQETLLRLEVLIPLILPSTRKPRETGALVAVHPNYTPHPRYERSPFCGPDVLAYETSTSASHEGRPVSWYLRSPGKRQANSFFGYDFGFAG